MSHEPLADRRECREWSPPEGDLLVVATLPDDVQSVGGLIRAWAARGFKVTVLSVSDGEGLSNGDEAAASVRREAMTEALRKLCPTHVAVTRLGLPVDKVSRYLNRLRNSLLSLASGPVTVIAPHERSGRADREAVEGVCVEFARSTRIPLARYAVGRAGEDAMPAAARWVKFPLSDEVRRAKARMVGFHPDHPRRDRPRVGRPSDQLYEAFLL